jgi:HEAT repeat protein
MLFATPQLPRTLTAALRDAADKSPDVRRSALRDLARHHADVADEANRETIASALLEALEDEAPPVRGEAAEQLGVCRVTAALPALLAAVEDPHVVVRQMAIAALGDIGDTRAVGRLERALADERPELRYQATMALPRLSPRDASTTFMKSLADDDPDIRHIALRVAEELYFPREALEQGSPPFPAEVRARAGALLVDEHHGVRLAAALLLAAAGDEVGADVLLDVVATAPEGIEPDDEGAAVEAVGDLCLAAALPALRTRAFGVSRFVRERFSFLALVSLAKLGDAQAQAKIIADLDAWSREKRGLAVLAVGRARVAAARPRLVALRERADASERALVDDALAALDDPGEAVSAS